MGFKQEKKPYLPPTVTKLTPNQARQLVANRINGNEEEAADFLESMQEQKKTKEQASDYENGNWKRSA
jgi:hypothetical protein